MAATYRRLSIGENPAVAEFCAQRVQPEAGVRQFARVGFIGDVMCIAGKRLQVDATVAAFFADCEMLVGNLEGTIAPRPRHPIAEWHDPAITEELGRMFEPSRFYLNVANNHAADFGPRAFDASVHKLRRAGFNVFGTKEEPFADIGPHVRVLAGSMWTNKPCNWIADLDDLDAHPPRDGFLLYYPHWGYEMEWRPRREILERGERLLQQADALIGHHSHVPQAVRLHRVNGRTKVLATSLGGFCASYRERALLQGVIMKLAVGPRSAGGWGVAEMEWRFVECVPGRTCTVKIVP